MLLAFIVTGILLAIAYTILMLSYLHGWKMTPVFERAPSSVLNTSVSIIIAVRNEEQQIGNCLESILAQDHPADLFEVIVVDDHSNDDTLSIVKEYERVRLVQLQRDERGKKKAIEKGIETATGKLIVTTDADCMMGKQWLSTIVGYHETIHPVMMAGPVYFREVKGILAIWQALDFAGLMGITAAGIQLRFPQMCNGANLVYEKDAFLRVGGFEGIDEVPTGDDILLMLKMSRQFPGRINFLRSPQAIVQTLPQQSLSSLISQRLRWVSKSRIFPDRRITAVLTLGWLFNFWILTTLFISLFYPALWWFLLVLFLLKMVLEIPLLTGSLRVSGQTRYLWHLPWVQVMHILYVVMIGPISLFAKYNWKDRKY